MSICFYVCWLIRSSLRLVLTHNKSWYIILPLHILTSIQLVILLEEMLRWVAKFVIVWITHEYDERGRYLIIISSYYFSFFHSMFYEKNNAYIFPFNFHCINLNNISFVYSNCKSHFMQLNSGMSIQEIFCPQKITLTVVFYACMHTILW